MDLGASVAQGPTFTQMRFKFRGTLVYKNVDVECEPIAGERATRITFRVSLLQLVGVPLLVVLFVLVVVPTLILVVDSAILTAARGADSSLTVTTSLLATLSVGLAIWLVRELACEYLITVRLPSKLPIEARLDVRGMTPDRIRRELFATFALFSFWVFAWLIVFPFWFGLIVALLSVIPLAVIWFLFAVFTLFATGLARTLLIVWIAVLAIASTWQESTSQLLPGSSLATVLHVLTALKATEHSGVHIAHKILVCGLCAPAAMIAAELMLLAVRDAIAAIRIVKPKCADGSAVLTLRKAWERLLPALPVPYIVVDHQLEGPPEVRILIWPPFRYVAIPSWFAPSFVEGLLESDDLILILAHEYFHYKAGWPCKVLLRATGFLCLRCPDTSLILIDGADEFAADRFACECPGAPPAQLLHAIQVVNGGRRPAPARYKRGMRSTLKRLVGVESGLAGVSPSLESRATSLLTGRQPDAPSSLERGVFDIIVPFSLGATTLASFIVLATLIVPLLTTRLGSGFQLALPPAYRSAVRDIAATDNRVVVLYEDSIASFDINSGETWRRDLPPQVQNAWRIVATNDKRVVVGSAWRGAWVLNVDEWMEVRFATERTPAVLYGSDKLLARLFGAC